MTGDDHGPDEFPSRHKRIKPQNRELAEASQHRLPYVGRMQVIEQLETYFKVEQSISFKKLVMEEVDRKPQEEAKLEEVPTVKPPAKKKSFLQKVWQITSMMTGKKFTSEKNKEKKDPIKEKAEEET